MTWYAADVRCPRCGRLHWAVNRLRTPGGPTTPGTASDLYPGALPPELADLLRDKVWCDQAGGWVELADPARILLRPLPTETER